MSRELKLLKSFFFFFFVVVVVVVVVVVFVRSNALFLGPETECL